ncbi:NAD-dependent succinate-semialdehyde dehydrogenase [Photobacterium sp. TY1-4]|uniref:NAD-dependent succinate-semialdehyde dehydrogenase n=1 Tax=Photobacterium sp. TY1-4 TaxID=2899122 RepID=UPI0021BE3656|nr:NAD-dependent succinate-semialdehyde dehydrogenase [Photobacterium sp. TY1-4]UXI03478.1 NAD-dependent succinate-semialdehyde dehydrogenase [Photobacterium sp. TY1-4]
MEKLRLALSAGYINGQWVAAESGASVPVANPATGEVITHVPDMGPHEAEAAVLAADAAFQRWRKTTAKHRAGLLRAWFNLMVEHAEELARLLTSEQGKPYKEAYGEVLYGASFIEWFAEEAKRTYGDHIPSAMPGTRYLTLKQPVGVVTAITPWNFPIAMITRKVAPALAAGCTVVVKPGEDTPLCALAMAKLAELAGIPAGVINVVTTANPAPVGEVLCTHPLVRKVSFTGSTPVGKHILRQAADTVKKVSMELGGNAPFMVFDDADLDKAVQGALISKYRNAGQTCVCTNRLYVHDAVYDQFMARYIEAVSRLKVGDGLAEGTDIGPLINARAITKVDNLVAEAVCQGANLVLGGAVSDVGPQFYQPTILTDVTEQMAIAHQELFGPVTTVFRFNDEADVVRRANDTPFGLAAYFYTRDHSRIWRVSEALEYGIVGINEGIISTEVAPFGGVKESGCGREGSKYGIEDYLEIKYLCLGIDS